MQGRPRLSLIATALALIVAACSSGTVIPDGGTAADGGGVCCPIVGGAPCNCAGGGGWAPTADQCSNVATCDAWFDTTTDAHGCAALDLNPSKCCGCPADSGSGDAIADVIADVTGQ